MSDEHFKVEVDGAEFDIVIQGSAVVVNGQPVDASITHVGGSTYSILVGGRSHEFTLTSNGTKATITGIAGTLEVTVLDRIALLLRESEAKSKHGQAREIHAPMPGLVLKIEVTKGETVNAGSGLLVLEAMKMENQIFSSTAATVQDVHVSEGEAVKKGQLLVTLA